MGVSHSRIGVIGFAVSPRSPLACECDGRLVSGFCEGRFRGVSWGHEVCFVA
jgi:hypothetical protein